MYKIIDKHTGLQIGKDYKKRVAAHKMADKLDNVYGAYKYIVKSNWSKLKEV